MIPADLRSRIAADFAAVRPLRPPSVRAAALIPFALLALLAAPAAFELRSDADRLGWALTWGLSWLQAAAGFALLSAALREAIPGRTWSRGAIVTWLTAPFLLLTATTLITWDASPIPLQRGW